MLVNMCSSEEIHPPSHIGSKVRSVFLKITEYRTHRLWEYLFRQRNDCLTIILLSIKTQNGIKTNQDKKIGVEKQVFKNQSFITKAQFLSILPYLGLNTKREHLRKTQVLSVCVLRCFSCIQLLATL